MDEAKSPHPVDIEIGARVRAARIAAGLSQAYLADKLGLAFQQIQKYERGVNRISASRLVEMSAVIGVAPEDFFKNLDRANQQSMEFARLTAPGVAEMLAAFVTLPQREQRAVLRLCHELAECSMDDKVVAADGLTDRPKRKKEPR